MIFSRPRLYAITQRFDFPDLTASQYLGRLFGTRAEVVQLREKDLDVAAVRYWSRLGVELARRSGKVFLLNTHVELALDQGCHGVHLTSLQSLPDARKLVKDSKRAEFLIGKSVHSLEEAEAAEREGADYVMLGPVFAPISKPLVDPPLALEGLQEAVRRLRIPVAAVGGLDGPLLEKAFQAGAWAAAGITWAAREIQGSGHDQW